MENWLILKYRFRFFLKIFLRIFYVTFIFFSLFFVYKCFYDTNSFLYKKRQELLVLSKTLTNYLNKDICNQFRINGVLYSDYIQIQNNISKYCSDKYYTISDLKNDIIEDPWIKNISIYKKYPNNLEVKIIEYNPFAVWINQKGKYKLIDEYGDIINIPIDEIKKFNNLIIIVGDNVKSEIYNIFNLLSIYNNVSSNLVKIIRVGNRRWDLVLKNNLIIKMPEEGENLFKIWQILDNILNIYKNDKNLKIIDLRINNKIYLQYNECIVNNI